MEGTETGMNKDEKRGMNGREGKEKGPGLIIPTRLGKQEGRQAGGLNGKERGGGIIANSTCDRNCNANPQ